MCGPDAVNILWNKGLRKIAERVCRELDIGTMEEITALTNEQIETLDLFDWHISKLKSIRNALLKDILHSEATEKVADWLTRGRPPRVPVEKRTKLKDYVRREAAHPTEQEEKHRHDTFET